MAFKLIIGFILSLTAIFASKETNIPRKHAIKTIWVKDGDIIDCVDIYNQPAFDHPLLKNHIVQMKSSHLDQIKYTSKTLQNSSSKAPSQPWLQYGRCPNGTIPIRRSSNNHQTNIYPRKFIHYRNHSFAVVLTAGHNYSGARANIRVWNPYVEYGIDYSSSQVTLRAGPINVFEPVNEIVEAGWTVNLGMYSDLKTRLFAYWSVDNSTGCFDLTCPGFVQTSSKVLLGGDIGSYNNGSEILFQISKDPDTNNWWFLYNSEEVGYWPSHIFQAMKYEANMVEWGGEVYSPFVGTLHPHTNTAMGSGRFPDRLHRISSGTMTGMLVEETEENSSVLKRPESFTITANEWTCYDVDLVEENVPEPVLVYGGPGGYHNPSC